MTCSGDYTDVRRNVGEDGSEYAYVDAHGNATTTALTPHYDFHCLACGGSFFDWINVEDHWNADSLSVSSYESALISRMERAPDFGYDDEEISLSNSLSARGLAWRWTSGNKVDVYRP